MYKILIGEDTLRGLTETIFSSYEVDFISSYDQFLDVTYTKKYDLYILNLFYFDTIKEIQSFGDKAKVIFVDEFYNIANFKKALTIGDDYITKPIYLEELSIRVLYHYRKLFNQQKNIIVYKQFYFHVNSKQFFNGKQKINISPNELKLIELFFTNINKPISKDIIYEVLESSSDGSLRVYISKLKKLGLSLQYTRANLSYTLEIPSGEEK
jgi:DNA-binding response OmpR family regulator